MAPALRPIHSSPALLISPTIFAFSIVTLLSISLIFIRFHRRHSRTWNLGERRPLLVRGRRRVSRRYSRRASATQGIPKVVGEMEHTPPTVIAARQTEQHNPIVPKNVVLVVERRVSDSSIASASTMVETPGEERAEAKYGRIEILGKGLGSVNEIGEVHGALPITTEVPVIPTVAVV